MPSQQAHSALCWAIGPLLPRDFPRWRGDPETISCTPWKSGKVKAGSLVLTPGGRWGGTLAYQPNRAEALLLFLLFLLTSLGHMQWLMF